MTPDPLAHLSADELDALHDNVDAPRATSHIATCQPCHDLYLADRRLVALLSSLPTWDASPDLAPHVLTALRAAPPTPERVTTGPLATVDRATAARRRILVAGGAFGVVLAAGFGWAAFNPVTASHLVDPLIRGVTESAWLVLQAVIANTTEQPWFGTVRDALATPIRAVTLLAIAGTGYALILSGFRKVLSRSATHASS